MKQITVNKANGTSFNLVDKTKPCTIVSARQEWTLNGDDLVNVNVKSAVALDLGIGDTITAFGRVYKLNRLPRINKTKTNLFEYQCEFEGIQYDLMRVTYDLTVTTTSCQLQDIQADTLTGDLARFAAVLVANANRVFPNTWAVGTCPATVEDKCLTFGEDSNCLSVLQTLCSEFKVEFNIEQVNGVNTINFATAVGSVFPYTFKFGHSGGLYNLQRQNVDSSNIVTRLKVFGSTQNITSKYRANRLCLPGKSKGQSYIEKAAAIAAYGVFEATKYFDDIKPTFDGEVTAIDAGNVLKFVDTSMFDLNAKDAVTGETLYLLAGVSAKIHFNTGNLAGYEFDIHSYDHATHTFTLCKQTDERGDEFPSASSAAFQIAVGNKYKILDVALPQQYESAAESELETAGADYLDANCQPLVKYGLSIAKAYLQDLIGTSEESVANVFEPGDYIPIQDTDIGVDKSVRVKQLSRNVLDAYDYVLTISDLAVNSNITTRVISDINDIKDIIINNNLQDPARARASWRTSRELLNMVFDPEGDYYTDKIKPNSIDTLLLSVGAKSMQFGLVGTVFQPNYQGNKNSMKVTGGTLVHYTINEDSAVSWTLANQTYTFQNDSDAFYIYAKCSRTTNSGTVIFTTQQIACESDPDFYHFWIGVLHQVDTETGVRDISLSYGFTQINGRYITTGRIQSADGMNYIDLDENKIRFGNQSCYVDFNVTANGQFSMRNVKVVSGSGEYFDIPVYRGEYNSSKMYYSGDEVFYTSGGKTATYRYINATPTTGHAPTETSYWRAVATGKDGQDGQNGHDGQDGQDGRDGTNGSSIEVQFSVNGSSSWHSSFQSGDKYMRERVGSGSWSSAIKIVGENGQDGQDGQDGADGSWTSFVFKASQDGKPATPTGTNPIPPGWSDDPPVCDVVTPTYTGDWIVKGNKIESNPITHRKQTWEKVQIVTTKANTNVAVHIAASSEARYDFGYICNLDEEYDEETSTTVGHYQAKVSGIEKALVIFNIPTAGTHFFYMGYTKDGSQSTNDDKVYVTILDKLIIWMSSAVVTNGVAGTWSEPVWLSGRDGETGEPGTSPSSLYRGDYSSIETYYGNPVRTDIVKYNGAYYRANPKAPTESFVGHPPTETDYWQPFGQNFENIATGFLFAQEAVLDNAVVRILRTAETGKRIEVTGNQMSMFDSSGIQKLRVSGDNVDIGTPTLSYPLNYHAGFTNNHSKREGSGQEQETFTICNFSVAAANSTVQFPAIRIGVSVGQYWYGGGITDMDGYIRVYNSSNQVVATLGSVSAQSDVDITSAARSLTLGAGSYTIKVVMYYEWDVDQSPEYDSSISVSAVEETSANVVVTSNSTQGIQIGANGIAIHLGNSFSAVFALDSGTPTILLQGLNASSQTIGLKITRANGVQINRGSGWQSL